MEEATIAKIAEQLYEAKLSAATIARPSSGYLGFSLAHGYQIMADLDNMLRDTGFKRAGRKIGFTNRETWERFNLSTPIWAYVYDRTVTHAQSGKAVFDPKGTVAPMIETEVVLWIGDDIPRGKTEPKELINHLKSVSIGFEIVDCHYPEWEITAEDAVADFGVHSHLIIGPPLALAHGERDLILSQLESFQVALFRNGEPVARGKGENALGSPVRALGYLAEVLGSHEWAPPLAAGEMVTTGTLTTLIPVVLGEVWSVEIGGIGLEPFELEITGS